MNLHAGLAEEVRCYSPEDENEAAHQRAISELLTTPAGVSSRAHFVPGHLTASLFIVDPDSANLLLHHHRRLNRWLQMGGHLEAGETARDAALREGEEESGLTDLELVMRAIFDLDVHAIPAGKGEPDHRHFDIRYLARTRSPSAIVADPVESSRLEWIPIERAEELMNEEASSRVIRKIRRVS